MEIAEAVLRLHCIDTLIQAPISMGSVRFCADSTLNGVGSNQGDVPRAGLVNTDFLE
jgi:hypothetical protein